MLHEFISLFAKCAKFREKINDTQLNWRVPILNQIISKYWRSNDPPHIIIAVVYIFYVYIFIFSCPHKHVFNCKKLALELTIHRAIILNRGSMFAFQWREFSPPLSSAHRLLQCYHSQWEIGDVAILREFPLSPSPPPPPLGPLANEGAVSCDVTLHILVGKICISFFLFKCEAMLSLVVLWLCGTIWRGLYRSDSFCGYRFKYLRK